MNRSAEDVFGYATDSTRFGEWQKGVLDGHMDAADTRRVGAQCVTTRSIGFADQPVTAGLALKQRLKRRA